MSVQLKEMTLPLSERIPHTLPEGWEDTLPPNWFKGELTNNIWLRMSGLETQENYLACVLDLAHWAQNLDICLEALPGRSALYYMDDMHEWVVRRFGTMEAIPFSGSTPAVRYLAEGRMMYLGQLIYLNCDRCDSPTLIGESVCADHQVQYCANCGEEEISVGDSMCEYCYEAENAESDPEVCERFDHNEGEGTTVLGFTPRPFNHERGDMRISVELEFGGNPSPVASTLYNRGLASSSSVDIYSAQQAYETCVKYDGSVDGGGEMVISKVPCISDTNRLWQSLNVLREQVKEGDNHLDMRCGCHIHVDMTGRPLTNLFTSMNAYNHIEDILYRIASANYKFHRMENGNQYGDITPKSFSKQAMRDMRGRTYWGMNIGGYTSARYHCDCGVGFDRGDVCTCDMSGRKNTVEFRLWNTTSNSIKLHAFIALSAALVAYGENRDVDSTELPPMQYGRNAYITLRDEETARHYASRLVWMFQTLPLSAEERDSIRYCLRKSDIGPALSQAVVDGYLEAELVMGILERDDLLDIPPYVKAEPIEQPPVPEEPPLEYIQEYWVSPPHTYSETLETDTDHRCMGPCSQCRRTIYWPSWAMMCTDHLLISRNGGTEPMFTDRNNRLRWPNGVFANRNMLTCGSHQRRDEHTLPSGDRLVVDENANYRYVVGSVDF